MSGVGQWLLKLGRRQHGSRLGLLADGGCCGVGPLLQRPLLLGRAGPEPLARLASSWAVKAIPKNIAIPVRLAHSNRAMTPVSGPKVAPKSLLWVTKAARSRLISHHSAVARPAPTINHDRPGCCRRGACRNSSDTVTTVNPRLTGQRIRFRVVVVAALQWYQRYGGTDGPASHPIDPVGPTLDLAGGGGERHHRRQQTKRQRHLAQVAGAPLVGEQLADQRLTRPRGQRQHGVGHHPTTPMWISQFAGQPVQGDQQGDCGQAQLQSERPGVAEPVAGAEPQERVVQQAPAAVAAQGPPGMVGRQLTLAQQPGFRDPAAIAHRLLQRRQSVSHVGCGSRPARIWECGPSRSAVRDVSRARAMSIQLRPDAAVSPAFTISAAGKPADAANRRVLSSRAAAVDVDGGTRARASRPSGSDHSLSASDPRHA